MQEVTIETTFRVLEKPKCKKKREGEREGRRERERDREREPCRSNIHLVCMIIVRLSPHSLASGLVVGVCSSLAQVVDSRIPKLRASPGV